MALTNKGFNGTVTEADFAYMGRIGMAEGVESAGAWAVTQGTGRQVSVAASAGWAFSCGVISKDTAAILTSLGTPTNGQWYLIVRRINWATDTVTVVAIPHTTTSTTIPTGPPTGLPTMSTTPGTEWDQKLAWAWVRSTDTTMFLVDLRKQPLADRVDLLESARGTGAILPPITTPAALDSISNAVVGDRVLMTTPGTGISPLEWIAISGSGATIDWRPAGMIIAATKANLDSFISVVAAIADTVFEVGAFAVALDVSMMYRFTTTLGVYVTANTYGAFLRTTNQTLSAGVDTAISWDSESSDLSAMRNPANPTRVLMPIPGVWEFRWGSYVSVSSGQVAGSLRRNGAGGIPGSYDRRDATAGAGGPLSGSAFVISTAATDYVELLVSSSVGASAVGAALNAGAQGTSISGRFLGAA